MGTGEIGAPALHALLERADCDVIGVVTQPDKPAGRHRTLKASRIKEIALTHGIPVLQPESLRRGHAVDDIRALEPDFIVVMAYGQILPPTLLAIPPIACVNLHASLLPKFRGASPIQAAIRAGEPETGITLMHMAEGLDTGDMICITRVPIRRRDTGSALHDRLALAAPLALAEGIDRLLAGTATCTPQNDADATYAGRLTRDDARVDWTRSACEIDRLVRAMNPWPVAWSHVPLADGTIREIKILSAIIHRKSGGPPGQILSADSRGLLVACGSGALLLRTVQLEGRRRMSSGELLRGTAVTIGAVLS